ncbi:MAG: hypothetical protein K5989_04565 [Lachnospiraceae bacterium]|nr:hypothetical protein [Lachnospiraceae bacterium]
MNKFYQTNNVGISPAPQQPVVQPGVLTAFPQQAVPTTSQPNEQIPTYTPEPYQENNNGGIDWDDVITDDGGKNYILLEPGTYQFTVTKMERSSFPGSDKIPPCHKAVLTLQIDTNDGPTTIKTNLLLSKSLEWKLSSFFRSIGQKRRGEALRMDWQSVVGAKGVASIIQRKYVGKDYQEHTINDVDKYLDHIESGNSDSKGPEDNFSFVSDEDDLPFM